jgi:hypothetical protein
MYVGTNQPTFARGPSGPPSSTFVPRSFFISSGWPDGQTSRLTCSSPLAIRSHWSVVVAGTSATGMPICSERRIFAI